MRLYRRRPRVLALLAATATLVLIGPPAQATPAPDGPPRAAGSLLHSLAARLGDRAVGGFLDRRGRIVVNVIDGAAARLVRTAGASARVVDHSAAELARVLRVLGSQPGVPDTAWGIDPVTNQVELSISRAAPDAGAARLVSAARRFGDAVRIEWTGKAFVEHVYGGEQIGNGHAVCSAGFNVTSGGRDYLITAGHCTRGLPYWKGIGPSLDSHFPGSDYGLIANQRDTAPGAVRTGPASRRPITSVGRAIVGEHVCASGRTTGVTCGKVTGIDRTVHYDDGTVVHGLIETDVHTAPGDSGGPLYHGSTGLGTVSGGDGSTDFFQPLGPVMRAYGMRLVPASAAPQHAAASPGGGLLGLW